MECEHKNITMMEWPNKKFRVFCRDCNKETKVSREVFDWWKGDRHKRDERWGRTKSDLKDAKWWAEVWKRAAKEHRKSWLTLELRIVDSDEDASRYMRERDEAGRLYLKMEADRDNWRAIADQVANENCDLSVSWFTTLAAKIELFNKLKYANEENARLRSSVEVLETENERLQKQRDDWKVHYEGAMVTRLPFERMKDQVMNMRVELEMAKSQLAYRDSKVCGNCSMAITSSRSIFGCIKCDFHEWWCEDDDYCSRWEERE